MRELEFLDPVLFVRLRFILLISNFVIFHSLPFLVALLYVYAFISFLVPLSNDVYNESSLTIRTT